MQHAPALIPAIIVLCLFLVSGILSLGAAIANWEWFFNSKNCRIFTSRLSRRQARWLYGLLGALILLMTAVIARDLLQKTRPHEPSSLSTTVVTTVHRDCNTATNDSGSTIFATPNASAKSGAISQS